MARVRNDIEQYDRWDWWGGERHTRLLHNLVAPRMRHFTPIVGDWRGKHTLEVGCGGGFMTEAVARAGARVLGVDPSGPALARAREHAAAEGLTIEYLEATGDDLPLADGTMDVVLCVDVLEHVPDPAAVCREIARVLRPGGVFLFDTFNRTWLSRLIAITIGEDLLGVVPPGTHDPEKFIRPAELEATLRAVGLQPGPIVGLGPIGLNRRLDFVFGRVPTRAVQYIGHATRSTP